MSLKGTTNAQKIWNFLIDKGLSPHGAAGLMGNLYAESGLIPTNLQNTYEKSLGMTDVGYTAAVDAGTYANFVKDSAGYGIAQWTYWSRKQALLNYAKSIKTSIGDLEMQLLFLWKELSEGYGSVLSTLKSAKSIRTASDAVLTKFERPADMGTSVQAKRAGYGQTYYDQFAGTDSTVKSAASGSCTAARLLEIAAAELGYKEKASNNNLDNKTANAGSANFTKYARDLYAAGYYNGNKNGFAWCDVFVDWCFYKLAGCDAKRAQEVECQTGDLGAGCTYSLQYYQKQGRFFTTNPQPGDQIFFKSNGSISHTGIVESVNGSTIVTIEGNAGDQVKRINRKMNDGYTYGFGRPKFDSVAAKPNTQTETTKPSAGTAQSGATALKVGDVVTFTGSTHYASANATSGPACKPGKAKVTAIYKTGKHPIHLVAVNGGGSNVYGWVNTSDINGQAATQNSSAAWTPKVGDVVNFKGSKHYVSANATSAKSCKGGKAKITQIYQPGKSMHPYHLVGVSGSGATVHGWVDAGTFNKG